MANRRTRTALGAFVVGALALATAFGLLAGAGVFAKRGLTYVVFFPESVGGLSTGAAVTFKGVRVGSVKDVAILLSAKADTIHIPVIVEIEPKLVRVSGVPAPERSKSRAAIEELVRRGLRARLVASSLVTGQKAVELDLRPEVPVVLVGAYPNLPELPAMASSTEELQRTLARLPLEEIVRELQATLRSIHGLVSRPQIPATAQSVTEAAQEFQRLARGLESETVPAMKEVGDTARTLRSFIDYLEQHPESLLRGKGGPNEQSRPKEK